jgi:hypothetical protein
MLKPLVFCGNRILFDAGLAENSAAPIGDREDKSWKDASRKVFRGREIPRIGLARDD